VTRPADLPGPGPGRGLTRGPGRGAGRSLPRPGSPDTLPVRRLRYSLWRAGCGYGAESAQW